MCRPPDILESAIGFLAGGGEMGALTRAFAWAENTLGCPEAWPQSLKVAVRTILNSRHPMFIWWGPELIQFYNDAYRRHVGPEVHPAALGARGRETWTDIWPVIGPQIEQVMAGGGATWHEDHLVPIRRHGRVEDVWWTYGYSPIDDETAPGGIGGVLVICHETTDKVVAQERQAFLLDLSDALRPLSDPAEILACAGERLGRRLRVGQVAYAAIDAAGTYGIVEHDWNDGTIASGIGRHRLADLGPALTADLKAGTTVRIDDIDAAAPFRQREIRAFVKVPLLKQGRLEGIFAIRSGTPRAWSDRDVAVAEETAERVRSALESAATAAALRESERRFRQFGEASSDVLWIRDSATGKWEYLTPAFEKIYGVARETAFERGTLLSSLMLPEDRERTRPDAARARAGENVSLEYRIRRPSDGAVRWIRSTSFPLDVVAGKAQRIGGIVRDVTEEREMEERLQVLVAELQHRTRNLLGVINAIANQTFENSKDPKHFRESFRARLEALARANDLLSHLAAGEKVTFDGLLRVELGALGALDENGLGPRVTLDGESGIALRPRMVQTLALAVHELATNAIKYGALTTEKGRLLIKWARSKPVNRTRSVLRVVWHESGVEISDHVRTELMIGYGRRLIEKALPYQFDAETSYELLPDGVHCTIDLPVLADA